MGIIKKTAVKNSGLKDIYLGLKEIVDETSLCKKCGKCQAVCPVFKEIGNETLTSRGKLQLLGALDKKLFKNPGEVEKRLRFCLLCSKCSDVCPQNIDTNLLFMKARLVMAEYDKKSFVKKFIIKLFIKLPKLSPLFLKPETSQRKSKKDKKNTQDKKVVFFSGCLFDKLYPDKIDKAVRIIKKAGYECEVVKDKCCGIPLLTSGDEKGFNDSKKNLLSSLNKIGASYIVSGCPTCIHVLKNIWPGLDKDVELQLDRFEILDFHGFLYKNLDKFDEKNIRKNKIDLSWHKPCHLTSLGIDKEVSDIFNKFCTGKNNFHDDKQTCCGFGGTFSLDHPLLSKKMGEKRGVQLNKEGDFIVTGCPACMSQLKRFSAKDIFHTIDLVFDCMKDI